MCSHRSRDTDYGAVKNEIYIDERTVGSYNEVMRTC